jgi:hypothetical protein
VQRLIEHDGSHRRLDPGDNATMRSSVVMLGLVTGLGGLAAVGALGGCGFSSPPCATGGSQFDTCLVGVGDDLMLSGSTITYDTTTHELRVDGAVVAATHMTLAAKAGDVDAIVANNVRLAAGAQLRATGIVPFAIIASGSVTLEDGASIDVSNGGAGALPTCANPAMAGSNNSGGGGGGGGGGYGAAGGEGGNGNNGDTQAGGGSGGGAIGIPAGPVGGCPGARGGRGTLGNAGAPGGLGGGALYVVAADRIELGDGATLTAGGGGGRGGGQMGGSIDGGGGGGGSGGMILLEVRHVIGPQARVVANGGGGGEGADLVGSGGGFPVPHAGKDGEGGLASSNGAAGGAGGAVYGADGGRGGSLEEPTGEAVTMMLDGAGGGGGGGGGVGFIQVESSDVQLGVVSPAAN